MKFQQFLKHAGGHSGCGHISGRPAAPAPCPSQNTAGIPDLCLPKAPASQGAEAVSTRLILCLCSATSGIQLATMPRSDCGESPREGCRRRCWSLRPCSEVRAVGASVVLADRERLRVHLSVHGGLQCPACRLGLPGPPRSHAVPERSFPLSR